MGISRLLRRFLVVLGCLLPYGAAAAQGLAVACGEVAGEWTWLLGGTVRLDPDGTATWSAAPGSSAGFGASWHCDTADGSIVVE